MAPPWWSLANASLHGARLGPTYGGVSGDILVSAEQLLPLVVRGAVGRYRRGVAVGIAPDGKSADNACKTSVLCFVGRQREEMPTSINVVETDERHGG
jgi:hypothetical protein